MVSPQLFPSAELARLRSYFPACEERVYLNNAGVAPTSTLVVERMEEWLRQFARNGIIDEPLWEELAERTRLLCSQLIGSHPDEICFVRNTSHGLSLVAEGIAWESGDEVAVCVEAEYPSNVYPWQRLAEGGVTVREIPMHRDGVTVEAVEALLTPKTRLLAVSAVQYTSGHCSDLRRLGELCSRRNVLFAVDGIQQVGAFPLNVEECHIDFLSADSHKWLLGLSGIGFLYVSRRAIDGLRPTLVGWKSTTGAWNFDEARYELRRDAAKLEEGSPAYAMLAGFEAALELLIELGIERIAAHIAALTQYAAEQLSRLGGIVAPVMEDRAGILVCELPGGQEQIHRVAEACQQQGIVISVRRGRLRVSPHLFNSEADIDRLVEVMATVHV